MKHKKRFLGIVAVFIAALFLMNTGSALAEELPSLHFRNEQVTGLTVTKEIYRNSSADVPLRSGTDADIAYYKANQLSQDEFIMYLYGGSDLNVKAGIPYTRSNKYGDYYFCLMFDDDGHTLILRPTNSSGDYEAYYYDDYDRIVLGDSEKYPGAQKTAAGYSSLTLPEKYLLDFGSTDDLSFSKNNNTGYLGEFYLFDGSDGDQVYFKNLTFTDYCIIEDGGKIDEINDEKIAKKLTGLYNNNTDYTDAPSPDIVKQYVSGEANTYEVPNYFDKPNDALTIKKTVSYFGATNPINEDFTFEVLINNENPGGYSYKKYEGDAVIEESTFDVNADTSQPALIKLKGSQRIEITGIMKNTPVEVREVIVDENGKVLNPYYSARTVDSNEEGEGYKLVTQGNKKYILWEGLFEKRTIDTAEFVNVPNVMSVKKTITNPTALENYQDYEFEFEVLKYNQTSENYEELAENKQLKYYLRDSSGNLTGDSSKNNAPFTTSNGLFRLHHGETAVFVELSSGEKYRITEKRALYNDVPVNVDFRMDNTVYDKETRPATVETAYTLASDDVKTFSNTYDKRLGLNVSKTVTDSYKRSNPNAEYQFRLEIKNGNSFTTVTNASYTGAEIHIDISGTETTPAGEIVFTLKDGQTANITNLKYGTYRVVEVNPNVSTTPTGAATPLVTDPNPQKEEHLFITDVQVSGMDAKTVNDAVNGDANSTLIDVVSDSFELGITDTKSVDFNNRVRELKYYFDVEKIIFIDKNIHDTADDTEQRFVFKVERFAEGQMNFSEDNLLECFYVDLSCETPMFYNGVDAENKDVVKWKNNSTDYPYTFYHAADDAAYPKSYFKFNEDRITKIQKVYQDHENQNEETQYQFPCSIWNGRRTIAVTKTGVYRVSEEVNWGGTDYDYWHGSNRYKGFGTPISQGGNDGYVVFSIGDVHGELFKNLTADADNDGEEDDLRPTASFTNSEAEFAYLSSQTYAENKIGR